MLNIAVKKIKMDIKSFRKLIVDNPLKDQFNSIEIIIHYDYLDSEFKLKGIQSIYKFVLDQVVGWNKIDKLTPYFVVSKTHFELLKSSIIEFVSHINSENQNNFDSEWNTIKRQLVKTKFNNRDFIFLNDSSETVFLASVYDKNLSFFNGALDYITQTRNHPINDIGYFTGMLLAYEFKQHGQSELTSRRNSEKLALSQIRNKYNEYIVEAEQQLNANLSDAKDNLTKHFESVDKLKEEKNANFESWFKNTEEEFDNFYDKSKNSIHENEKLYREKLRLEAPAQYWKNRAVQLKQEGNKYLSWLIGTSVVAAILLFTLLILLGTEYFETAFNDRIKGIKWSLILVTIISFLAFIIKILSKMTFSSFHLSRDAEEREQLTHFYLALKKDTTIEPEERQLILQSLFSRADTGLLKEDSSPTMPTSIIEKFGASK